MDLTDLQQIISRELDNALGADGSQLSTDRLKAAKYYNGEPFGNEVEGRSQVVTRDTLEVIEWVLPALLRIFCASDKIAEFEPTGGTSDPAENERREAAAEQATDYVSHIFYRDNPGFLILYTWIKDSLLNKLSWVKCSWDQQDVPEVNTYEGLSQDEYEALQTPDAQILDERSYPAPQNPFNEDSPNPEAPVLYDCTIRVVRKEGRVKIEPVPPEEVLVSRRAKMVDPTLPFHAHQREWTVTDLLEQGYDEDSVRDAAGQDTPQFNIEKIERFSAEDESPDGDDRTDEAMRSVWVEECYVRADYNGDGLAELLKVVTAGKGRVVLTKKGKPDIEEIDEGTLIAITPLPMPHKLVGMSVADLVMDLQLIKSTLLRQVLDAGYLAIAPRTIVGQGAVNENTYDDLLTVRPGGIIRANDATQIAPMPMTYEPERALSVIEYIDQTSETRTGISRRNQGLAPDDINKTAASVNMLQQAAAQRVELIARVIAETGVKTLVKRILGLVTKYQQHERIIRLTGKFVPMDPRQWRNSMDVTVSVGLGTGNKDQVLGHLNTILQIQQGIVQVQQGVQGPLVTAKNVFDVVERLTENAGFKESFFTNPDEQQQGPQQPPPPDPEMVKAQHQMQLEQTKAQMQQQIEQAKQAASVAADQRKEQFDMERDRNKAQLDASERDREFQQRAAFMQKEFELKQWEAQQKAALDMREMEMRAELMRRDQDMKAAAVRAEPAAGGGA